ncbi:MAG: CBS domain-containing protein [Oscillochloris sp.]|nr:CBS domain-containing protein [Oscillochloris sp.]
MLVYEVMTAMVLSVPPDEEYQKALHLMQCHKIHHLPVIDANGRLCGIVAERDLLVAAGRFMNTIAEVEMIMQRNVLTAHRSDSVADAARLMVRQRVGCLPVTDEADRVVGIVTQGDLLHALLEILTHSSQKVREREAGFEQI